AGEPGQRRGRAQARAAQHAGRRAGGRRPVPVHRIPLRLFLGLAADHRAVLAGRRLLRHRSGLGPRFLACLRLAQRSEVMTNETLVPSSCQPLPVGAKPKRVTRGVDVRWGDHVVHLGGSAPVVVQSMTNTDTVDAIATAIQVKELARAGSELVRITVNAPEAAREVPAIREQLDRMGVNVPLVGDFHYNGHKLLTDYPECAQALSKYRINPGNMGGGKRRDDNFA